MTRSREGGPLRGLVVVLVRPDGPHNVGGVARLCGNFGASLRLVAPQCDHTQTEAMRMAHPCQAELQAAPVWPELGPALADVAFSLATSGKLCCSKEASRHWMSSRSFFTPNSRISQTLSSWIKWSRLWVDSFKPWNLMNK
jgi:tRNA C32,U32 (ribose-2'-O)-methylase TrmJ